MRRAMQPLADQDYVDGVYDETGKQQFRPLNQKEKEWLSQFNQEYYLNNRSYEKPLHDPSYNKSLSAAGNARYRDIMTKFNYNTEIDYDVLKEVPFKQEDELALQLKTDGFENTLKSVIKECAVELEDAPLKDFEDILKALVVTCTRLIGQERKYQRKLKKLEKAKKESK